MIRDKLRKIFLIPKIISYSDVLIKHVKISGILYEIYPFFVISYWNNI